MFRFTIRDVLWLTALVAVGLVWLMDRDRIRRDRIELAKREAEHISRAKMWEAEAQRAEKRYAAINERLSGIYWALERRDIKVHELIVANDKAKFQPSSDWTHTYFETRRKTTEFLRHKSSPIKPNVL